MYICVLFIKNGTKKVDTIIIMAAGGGNQEHQGSRELTLCNAYLTATKGWDDVTNASKWFMVQLFTTRRQVFDWNFWSFIISGNIKSVLRTVPRTTDRSTMSEIKKFWRKPYVADQFYCFFLNASTWWVDGEATLLCGNTIRDKILSEGQWVYEWERERKIFLICSAVEVAKPDVYTNQNASYDNFHNLNSTWLRHAFNGTRLIAIQSLTFSRSFSK